MQRELTFRAWDTATKQMIVADFNVFGETTVFNLIENYLYDNPAGKDSVILRYNDVIITQYTGLVDKDGNRIYEGDILRYPVKTDWDVENFVAFEVFYHDGNMAGGEGIGFRMCRTHYHGSLCGGYVPAFLPKNTEQMMVVGNIYQNPDLLK